MKKSIVGRAGLLCGLFGIMMMLAGNGLAQDTVAGVVAGAVAAATPPAVSNTGDTAWMLMSTALVFLMIPGLAFFYGGLVRKKNVLSILMQCFVVICLITLQWVIFGYSLAFGPDVKGLIGNLDWAFLKGVRIRLPAMPRRFRIRSS